MKKILTIAIAVMMIAVMSVSVFAADTGKIYAKDLVSGTDYDALGEMSLQAGKGTEADENGGVLGLGPVDNGDDTFSDAFISFPVEVETAGDYDVIVRYAAKAKEGQNRCFVISVDGEEVETFENLNTGDWGVYALATINVHLDAGEHTVTLTNVENFDNSTYKAINVLYLEWNLTEADVVETPDEPTETPDEPTETPEEPAETPDEPAEEEENAPQTGVAAAILSVVAVLSGAYIVKKH